MCGPQLQNQTKLDNLYKLHIYTDPPPPSKKNKVVDFIKIILSLVKLKVFLLCLRYSSLHFIPPPSPLSAINKVVLPGS